MIRRIRPSSAAPSTARRLMHYLRRRRLLLVLSVLFALLHVASTLMTPIIIGRGVDGIVGADAVDFSVILRAVIALCVTAALAALFQWLLNLCTNKISFLTAAQMREECFAKLQSVPLAYIDTHPHGDIMTRVVADIDAVSDGLLQGTAQLIVGAATIVGTLICMVVVNPLIALVVAVLTPLSILVAAMIAKMIRNAFHAQSRIQGELGGFAEEHIANRKLVAAFACEHAVNAKYASINGRLRKYGTRAQFFSSLTNPSTRFINGLVYAAAGVTGALLAVNGAVTVGGISSFLSYANQYTKPFNEISGVITQLQSALASAARVFAVLDEADEAPDGEETLTPADCRGEVDLRDVSFSYQPQRPLITNLNLHVSPGSRVAIVGPTGCGKTTLINLLMRFYDVTAGEIAVEGKDIRGLRRHRLRALYGMVLQETWLFGGTIRENIAYGRPEATDDEIERAARAAYIHSFITRLPKGYDTVVDGGGEGISEGQKQLLCIARIMLTMPPMLILDEATSSIDTMTEQRIQRAFAKLMEGRTSFVVAHRLSTIRESDTILVMRDGNIVEQGSHEALLAENGFYAQLWNSQFARTE